MNNFNLPPGCTVRDCEGTQDNDAPIVCDGCGYAKQSTRYIRAHGAELCAACDAKWTAQAELDARQVTPKDANFENTVESFLMRD